MWDQAESVERAKHNQPGAFTFSVLYINFVFGKGYVVCLCSLLVVCSYHIVQLDTLDNKLLATSCLVRLNSQLINLAS